MSNWVAGTGVCGIGFNPSEAIRAGQNQQHARHRLGDARFNADDARMRMR
jgi:hypothetical protein